MRLAIWNNPITESIVPGLKRALNGDVIMGSAEEVCLALKSGNADVALIPSNLALSAPDDYDILPAVGLSSWKNPFSPLAMGQHLGAETLGIIHSPEGQLFALLAAIVLKEHYNTVAVLNERENMPEGVSDSALVTVPLQDAEKDAAREEYALDLGLEWAEMANYPFVWAVFVVNKDAASDHVIETIRDAVIEMDESRVDYAQSTDLSDEMEAFFLNELRLRMDDMAVASMTELCDHLYYYGLTEEILPVMFASLQNTSEDDPVD